MAAKVLIVGSGGREHALAQRLLESPTVSDIVVTPGNGGTVAAGLGSEGKSLRNEAGRPLDIAVRERVDLVLVGPEAPLCEGLVDELQAHGIVAYGPSRRAAELEGSKAFMKDFAARHGIRTARHVVVREPAQIDAAIAGFELPPVVKADGLCAGKGVVVAESHAEAAAAARSMLQDGRFGAAGSTVVVEERISGAEASVHALCDGTRALLLPAAQDHKRIGEGDRGPNTGGMGTYAPAPLVTPVLMQRIQEDVFARALSGMQAEGTPYRGTLFAGIMISERGEPYLLEFNVRFGDPETQVLMNTIEGDLFEALLAAAQGRLAPDMLRPSGEHAVCVVLAAAGYPDTPRTGDVIDGLFEAQAVEGVRIYHAGTRIDGARMLSAGGRVLGVTARGASLQEAHERAYRAAKVIRFNGRQMRRDIAARALGTLPGVDGAHG
ncbi:MAG TPA: phosphoribosylamine--glycine ligase [Polyangiaceae bacterium]|nr:phosphoribosylamine--glycine ligase [Polyangiaceae bacterium]